jgi:hypothetical protein
MADSISTPQKIPSDLSRPLQVPTSEKQLSSWALSLASIRASSRYTKAPHVTTFLWEE